MKTNVNEVSKTICTGCSACYNVCPVKAIEMKPDSEGFIFPTIDSEKCINCGLCYDRCPAVNQKSKLFAEASECYGVYAGDNIRMESSSGGVFPVLADKILKDGGYVCGAVWTDDWKVKHILSDDPADIRKMMGSKYVQSDTGDAFANIKEKLDNGANVLFSGCPCQVAGLNAYLNKKYDNLITIDIVCHGCPSQQTFSCFLNSNIRSYFASLGFEYEDKMENHITKIDFRNKYLWGWAHSLYIELENGAFYSKNKMETLWYSAFLKKLITRKSCGECKFATLPRQGDITLGDFWGASEFFPDLDYKKGMSVVTLNNKKGQALFADVMPSFKKVVKSSVEVAKKKNGNIAAGSKNHVERNRFFKLLENTGDFNKSVEYALKYCYDIGYIGWWYGENFGSALTNYALHQYLVSKKYSVLMIEFPFSDKKTAISDTKSRRLGKKYYKISGMRTLNEMWSLNRHCNTFVVGSDQLWNYYSTKNQGCYFFLDFVEDSKKKIAYATSFGHPKFPGPESFLNEAAFHLNRFDYVSVREDDAVDICRDSMGVDAVRNLDPVFICDKSEYDKLINDSNYETGNDYIFAYILSPTKEKRETLLEISRKLGKKIKLVLDGQGDYNANKTIMDMDDCLCNNLEICDWVKLIAGSDYVFTDSYHGLCFSIIFEKQFACVGNIRRGLSRFKTILSCLELESRMSFVAKDCVDIYDTEIDYRAVNEKLKVEIQKSREWLDNALEAKKVPKLSTYDMCVRMLRDMKKK